MEQIPGFCQVFFSDSGINKGGLVFAGYGIVSAKDVWDDYSGLDVKGKVVLVMPDLPASLAPEAKTEWTLEKKVKTAGEKGAVGLIEMDLSTPGAQAGAPAAPQQRPGVLRAGQCPEGFVVIKAGRDFLNDAFYLVGKSWRDLLSKTLRLKKPLTADLGVTVEMEAHFVSGERRRFESSQVNATPANSVDCSKGQSLGGSETQIQGSY